MAKIGRVEKTEIINKILNIVILILVLALIAVILYPQWQQSKTVKIRLGCDSTVTSAVFFVAEAHGFFKDNRIIPELVYFADARQAIDALFRGEIDCGIFPWHLIFKRMVEQQETTEVFVTEDFRISLPVDAVVVKPESPFKKLADLKKHKIGYPNQIRELLPTMLEGVATTERTALAAKDFMFTELSNRELLNELRQNNVDAVLVIEPERSRAIQESTTVLVDAPLEKYILSPFPGAAIGYTRPFLTKNQRICVRLKLALDAAIGFISQNQNEARKVLAHYLGYPEDVLSDCRLPDMKNLVEINQDMIKTLTERLKASGVLTSDIEVKPIFVEPAMLKPGVPEAQL